MNTITKQTTLITHYPCPGNQQVIRLKAPAIAQQAQPGHKVILNNQTHYIMRADSKGGWIELLIDGEQPPQQPINIEGPIGEPLITEIKNGDYLLIGEGKGIAPIIFLTEQLKNQNIKPLVLLESERLPFTPKPSKIIIPGMPHGVIATMPLLDDWGIPCRLASQDDGPGCYHGPVKELAEEWLSHCTEEEKEKITIVKATK